MDLFYRGCLNGFCQFLECNSNIICVNKCAFVCCFFSAILPGKVTHFSIRTAVILVVSMFFFQETVCTAFRSKYRGCDAFGPLTFPATKYPRFRKNSARFRRWKVSSLMSLKCVIPSQVLTFRLCSLHLSPIPPTVVFHPRF